MLIGDTVFILDDDIKGIITKINRAMVTVLTEDGFEMDFEKSQIVIPKKEVSKKDFFPNAIQEVIQQKEIKKHSNSKRVKPKERNQPTMEVDLHIHHLVTSGKGLSNFDMLNIQLDTAKKQLEFAIQKKLQRVVFIHGIGQGVLRQELETLFRRYDQVAVEDADFKKYGRGATEIYIFQNF